MDVGELGVDGLYVGRGQVVVVVTDLLCPYLLHFQLEEALGLDVKSLGPIYICADDSICQQSQ